MTGFKTPKARGLSGLSLALGLATAIGSGAARADYVDEDVRVIRAGAFYARISEGKSAVGLSFANHTTHSVELVVDGTQLHLESGGRGASSCEGEEPFGASAFIGSGEGSTALFIEAACGDHIEIVEEGTKWQR